MIPVIGAWAPGHQDVSLKIPPNERSEEREFAQLLCNSNNTASSEEFGIVRCTFLQGGLTRFLQVQITAGLGRTTGLSLHPEPALPASFLPPRRGLRLTPAAAQQLVVKLPVHQ